MLSDNSSNNGADSDAISSHGESRYDFSDTARVTDDEKEQELFWGIGTSQRTMEAVCQKASEESWQSFPQTL